MKLSNETREVLKNFATINQNLQFKAGNVIKTKSGSSNVFGEVTVEEEFPRDFAIYEMGRFLSAISLFNDPDLEFNDTFVRITDGRNSLDYLYADPTLISGANYDKPIKMPKTIAEFELSQDSLAKLQKAAAVLSAPNISIQSKDGSLTITVHDSKNSSSDKYSLDIGTADVDDFIVDLKLETLRFIPGNYEVTVTEKVVVKFKNVDTDLAYLVAGEISI